MDFFGNVHIDNFVNCLSRYRTVGFSLSRYRTGGSWTNKILNFTVNPVRGRTGDFHTRFDNSHISHTRFDNCHPRFKMSCGIWENRCEFPNRPIYHCPRPYGYKYVLKIYVLCRYMYSTTCVHKTSTRLHCVFALYLQVHTYANTQVIEN